MYASRTCNRYVVRAGASTLDFEAKSSLHPVRGRARDLAGYVDACCDGATFVVDPVPTMHVEFPVERLTSGNAVQDREMWKLLDSRRDPIVRADLRDLRPNDMKSYAASGEITLCGRPRRYEGTLDIVCDAHEVTIEGSLRVDIRDFGIVPPRFLMFSVQPEVTIRLHLVASPA